MLPSLSKIKTSGDMISTFKGLCAREYVPDGYFADLLNTTSNLYPALSPRARRGLVYQCYDMHGFHSHGEMCWAQGEDLYYNSAYVGSVEDNDKIFASLGAYIAIFPDKTLLNTDTGEYTRLENTVSAEGAVASISDAQGESATSSSYMKISAQGIGAGFKKGDQVEVSGFADAALNASYILQAVSDDFVVVLRALSAPVAEPGRVTLKRAVPDMDFVCALNNRLWGCSSARHEVYACKLGDPSNWHVFEGISTDSYAATIATPGDFTGACAFAGTVLFFKEDEIIKLFGTRPSNFQLISTKSRGVEKGSARSLCALNDLLYYKGVDGILAYDGSTPDLISAALGSARYDRACGGALNGRYYAGMRDTAQNTWALFVYDAQTGAWHKENSVETKFMEAHKNNLFIVCANNSVVCAAGAQAWYDESAPDMNYLPGYEMRVDWHASTGALKLSTPDKKSVTKLQIRFAINEGAALHVDLRYGTDNYWEHAATFEGGHGARTATIPLIPRRADSVYLKLSGHGHAVVYSIAKTIETGSEL